VRPAIIFDLDGTLVDSLAGIAASLNAALAKLGLPGHPLERVRRFIGSGAFMLCRRAIPAEAPDSVAREVERAFKRHYAGTWGEGTRLFPGIDAMIADLSTAGRRLAVLSNKPDAFTREIVEQLFPDRPFGLVRGQVDGFPRKPEPGALDPILGSWKITGDQALLVGDSTIDRETAANAGIGFLGVAWGYESPEGLGSRVARSVEDLRSRLASG